MHTKNICAEVIHFFFHCYTWIIIEWWWMISNFVTYLSSPYIFAISSQLFLFHRWHNTCYKHIHFTTMETVGTTCIMYFKIWFWTSKFNSFKLWRYLPLRLALNSVRLTTLPQEIYGNNTAKGKRARAARLLNGITDAFQPNHIRLKRPGVFHKSTWRIKYMNYVRKSCIR